MDEELERQRILNNIHLKDKVILIRMIDFFNNLEYKYGYDNCLRFCKNHKKQFMIYKNKMEKYNENNNLY